MALKTLKIEMECPNCGNIYEGEVERSAIWEKDRSGTNRLEKGVYVFEGEKENPKYVNCECGNTLVMKSVKNSLEAPKGIEFCSECGKMIDPRIACGDGKCEECD